VTETIPSPPPLAELKRLLAERGLRLTRRMGQNFCVDTNAARALVADSGAGQGDVVLEVGPGAGHLTSPLLAAGCRVLAIEYDRGLFEMLSETWSHPRLTLIHADILERKSRLNQSVTAALLGVMENEHADGFMVVANLPYTIATPFLMDLVLGSLPWRSATVTIQREAAERLTAGTSEKSYGAVSVVMQSFAAVDKLRIAPPEIFWPQPEVESAIVRLTPRDGPSENQRRYFSDFVHKVFTWRRKRLVRCLAGALKSQDVDKIESIIEELGYDKDVRPESIPPEGFSAIMESLSLKTCELQHRER
jgi:16S rRNA (adenine1518-N6/adenine1519-N6)-dimethyltransferase